MAYILRLKTEGCENGYGYKPLFVELDASSLDHDIRFCYTTAIEHAFQFAREEDAENFKGFLDYWGLGSKDRLHVSHLGWHSGS